MTINYLVEIYKKVAGGVYNASTFVYDTTPISITNDIIALDYDRSIENNADSFSLRVMNYKKPDGTYLYKEKINVDDRVMIYVTSKEAITSANKSSYMRFDGLVNQVNYRVEQGTKIISIKGFNRFEKILNTVFPSVYSDTASNIIQNLLEQVNDSNNFQINWAAGNATTSSSIEFYRNYRPVHEMIQELSRQNINKEFNALYYIDENNNFVWTEKSKDSDTISINEGVDFVQSKINYKVWEVINALIIDCGRDPAGRGIRSMHYDEESAAEFGLKWAPTIEPYTEIATRLQERLWALDTWVDNSDENKKNFPDSSVYPLTLPWKERDTNGAQQASDAIALSDASLISFFRIEAKWQGIFWAKDVLILTGYVKPKIDITMNGPTWEQGASRTSTNAENVLDSSGNPIIASDYVNVVIPSYGGQFVSGFPLRCVQINQELSKDGWTTTMHLEVDPEDAKSYIASG